MFILKRHGTANLRTKFAELVEIIFQQQYALPSSIMSDCLSPTGVRILFVQITEEKRS
jgi:hypothetical protein